MIFYDIIRQDATQSNILQHKKTICEKMRLKKRNNTHKKRGAILNRSFCFRCRIKDKQAMN